MPHCNFSMQGFFRGCAGQDAGKPGRGTGWVIWAGYGGVVGHVVQLLSLCGSLLTDRSREKKWSELPSQMQQFTEDVHKRRQFLMKLIQI